MHASSSFHGSSYSTSSIRLNGLWGGVHRQRRGSGLGDLLGLLRHDRKEGGLAGDWIRRLRTSAWRSASCCKKGVVDGAAASVVGMGSGVGAGMAAGVATSCVDAWRLRACRA